MLRPIHVIRAGYRVAPDQTHAGALALNSGMDQDLEFPGAFTKVPDMLAQGLINETTLDRAVGNVRQCRHDFGPQFAHFSAQQPPNTRRCNIFSFVSMLIGC